MIFNIFTSTIVKISIIKIIFVSCQASIPYNDVSILIPADKPVSTVLYLHDGTHVGPEGVDDGEGGEVPDKECMVAIKSIITPNSYIVISEINNNQQNYQDQTGSKLTYLKIANEVNLIFNLGANLFLKSSTEFMDSKGQKSLL